MSKVYSDNTIQKLMNEILIHFSNVDPSISLLDLKLILEKHTSDLEALKPKDYTKKSKIASLMNGIFIKLNVQNILDFTDEEIELTINGVIPIIYNEDTQETRYYDIYSRIVIPKLFVSGQGHKAPVIITSTEDTYELFKYYIGSLVTYNGDLYINIKFPYVTEKVDEAQDLDLTMYSLNDKLTLEEPEDPKATITEFENTQHFFGSVPNHDPIVDADKLVRSDILRYAVVTDTKNIGEVLKKSTPQDLLLVKEVYNENPTLPPDQQPTPDFASLVIKYNDSIIWTKDYALNSVVNRNDIVLTEINGFTLQGIYDKPESDPNKQPVNFPVTMNETKVFYAVYTKNTRHIERNVSFRRVRRSTPSNTEYFESKDEFMQKRSEFLIKHNYDLSNITLVFGDTVTDLSNLFKGQPLIGLPKWITAPNVENLSGLFADIPTQVSKFNLHLIHSILNKTNGFENVKNISYLLNNINLISKVELYLADIENTYMALHTESVINVENLPAQTTGLKIYSITLVKDDKPAKIINLLENAVFDPSIFLNELDEGLYIDPNLEYRANNKFKVTQDVTLYIKSLKSLNKQIYYIDSEVSVNDLIKKTNGNLSDYILIVRGNTPIVATNVIKLPYAVKHTNSRIWLITFKSKESDIEIPKTFFTLSSNITNIRTVLSKPSGVVTKPILTYEHTKYLYNVQVLYNIIKLVDPIYKPNCAESYSYNILSSMKELEAIDTIIQNSNVMNIDDRLFEHNPKLEFVGCMELNNLNLEDIPLFKFVSNVNKMDSTFNGCINVRRIPKYWEIYPNIKPLNVFKNIVKSPEAKFIPVSWGGYQNAIINFTISANGGNLVYNGELKSNIKFDIRREELKTYRIPDIKSGWANYNLLGFIDKPEYKNNDLIMKPNMKYNLYDINQIYAIFGHEIRIEYVNEHENVPVFVDKFNYIENSLDHNTIVLQSTHSECTKLYIEALNKEVDNGTEFDIYNYPELKNIKTLIVHERY